MPPLPPTTRNVMIACAVAFLLSQLLPFGILQLWPLGSGAFWPWQLLSYALLHGDLAHLLFNMLGLWMFGAELERLWGPKRYLQFMAGAAVYIGGYLVFAVGPTAWPLLLFGFVLCGVGIGFAETAESTLVAKALPDRLRSNGFGVLGLTQAFGDLGATLVAGVLWSWLSPSIAFGYAAAWMVGSLLTARMATHSETNRMTAG